MLPSKFRLAAFFALLLAILAIGICTLHISLKYTYIGILAGKSPSGEWQVQKISGTSWAYAQRIPAGTRILAINDVSPDQFTLTRHSRVIERIESIELELDGERKFTRFEAYDTGLTLSAHVIAPFLFFAVMLWISFTLYRKKANEKEIKLLIAFSLTVALSYVMAGASARNVPFAILLISFTFPMIPTLLMHTLYAYLKKRGERFIPFPFICCGYLGAVGIICNKFLVLYTDFYHPFPLFSNNLPELIMNTAMNIILLVNMFRKFVRRPNPFHSFYKIVLAGQLLSFFPFVCLIAIPRLLFRVDLIPAEIAALFITCIPFFYIYLLTNNPLFDIDYVCRRVRNYALLAIVPASLVAGLTYLIWLNDAVNVIKSFQIFLLVHIAFVCLLFAKETLDSPRFGWLKRTTPYQRSLDRFTSRISQIMQPSELESALLEEIQQVLPVQNAALLEVDSAQAYVAVRTQIGLLQEEQVFEQLKVGLQDVRIGEFIPLSSGMSYLFGMKNGSYQIIWLTNKVSGLRFNTEEIAWMKTLFTYVTIVYENFQLTHDFIGKLQMSISEDQKAPPWLLRLLFSISEKERRRLSADLHDSALQDQMLWYRRFEDIMKTHSISAPLRQDMEQIREGLLDVVAQIRETCNELRPPFLKEIGIVEAIHHLLAQVRLRTNYAVEINAEAFHAELDDNQVLTLYRIVQELLQNADKHAKADQVDLHLSNTAESITLLYKDNGIGMDLTLLQSSFTHMGLWGIQERVASLDGKVMFTSAPGKGMDLHITIPLTSPSPLKQYVFDTSLR
ncbi:sensor histidine kinase [Paenibacillus sp. SI8]|uniref:sensor histidine kinase n=1 Tax=unclassified Paenibacillus TaxID=185978 RepID=UPI003467E119